MQEDGLTKMRDCLFRVLDISRADVCYKDGCLFYLTQEARSNGVDGDLFKIDPQKLTPLFLEFILKHHKYKSAPDPLEWEFVCPPVDMQDKLAKDLDNTYHETKEQALQRFTEEYFCNSLSKNLTELQRLLELTQTTVRDLIFDTLK